MLPLEQTDRHREPTRLVLKTLDWDTRWGEPAVAARHSYSQEEAAAAGYYFVQGTHEGLRDLGRAVVQLGGRVFDYLPHNAFEAWIPAGSVAAVRAAAQALLAVHPAYKIDPEVGVYASVLEDPRGRMLVAVEYWPDRDLDLEETRLRALEVEVLDGSDSGRYLRSLVLIEPARLAELARQPGVKWLQESPVAVLRNDKSVWVIQTNVTNNTKLWSQGVTGKDVTIGHIDGRIHEASCYFDDPSGAAVGPSHRKIKWWTGPSGSDSHGTHTAGSAAGNRQPVNGSIQYNGMAPDSYLVHHSSFPSGSNFLSFLNTAYSNGARIHTNSWGNDFTTSYDNWCRDIDAYSHDNEDGLVCFAVTNLSNLKNPENAKSCLAVAATSRTNQENFGSGGRGPTADGRRKPEVFAPGCSTNSASVSTCGITSMCGTSMACPVVTGGAALLKQYFEDGYYPSGAANAANAFTPSGSLLRACLANGAVNMSGISGYLGTQEGYGRILLDNVAFFSGDARRLLIADVPHSNGMTQGQIRSFKITIPAGRSELRATLCFADAPGAAFASNPVVNDLDLSAQAPDGTVYRGGILTTTDGSATPNPTTRDTKNSLEQILVVNPQAGDWFFRVEGTSVPSGPQGFGGVLTF